MPGHEEEIRDLGARIDAIAAHHRDGRSRVLEICRRPRSLPAVSRAPSGERTGYPRWRRWPARPTR